MLIRPSTPDDYAAIADLITQTSHNYIVTPDQLAYADANREAKIKFGRWVAEQADQVIGFAMHTQYLDLYDVDKLWVAVRVYPDHQRQGIGTQLYNRLLANVAPYDPVALRVTVREDVPASLHFATKRGFTEYSRRWESTLDVAAFDPKPYADLIAKLAAQGIVIKSLADLVDDPARDEKFYHLQVAIDQDVPMADAYTPPTREQFQKMVFENPDFMPEATFVAVHGDAYIGVCSHFRTTPQTLYIDLTGTRAEYRRRGIALALKVRGIQFAQAQGYRQMGVTNDPVNTGMLAINEQLGFLRQPAQIKLEKVLR